MSHSSVEIDRRKLFQIWKETQGSEKDKIRGMSREVCTAYSINDGDSCLSVHDVESALLPISKYFAKLYRKFHRCENIMMNSQKHYFEKPYKLPSLLLSKVVSTSGGRRPISFRNSSDVLKRRKTAKLRQTHCVSKLAYATQMKLRESGSVNAAKVVKEATMTSPTRASKMLVSWRNSQEKQPIPYSDMEALALIIDSNFTKSQYLKIQGEAKSRNMNLYPSYNKIVDAYSLETARYLVDLYPWYYMPASVHKILIHGAQVIEHFNVPIGQLSEEAQESQNKDLKRYRRDHTRKCSRTALNHDLIRRLLVSSDPLISILRKTPKKELKTMTQDAKFMLSFDDLENSDLAVENESFDDFYM